jgi:hypothetical protein
VAISGTLVVNVTLEVGDVTQSVNVEAASPRLSSATSELSQTFQPKMLTDAPLFVGGAMRNPEAFVAYMPGVSTAQQVPNGSSNNGAQDNSFNGGVIRAKEVLLDGASMTGQSGGGAVFDFVSVDQIAEFAVLTNNFSAEYGRTGGGIEVFVTKSGGNAVHGSVFDFLRNDKLDSAGWAVNSVPGKSKAPVRQNEFGVAVGGPIFIPKIYDGRNRTFFYFTFNGYRQNNAVSFSPITIATSPMTRGDFSSVVDSSGKVVPIYDPNSTATANGVTTRDQFPGNIIPASRFSSVSSKIVPLIPAPTNLGITNNYLGANGTNVDRTMWSFKGDHNFSDRNRLSIYVNRQERNTRMLGPLPPPLSNGWIDYDTPDNYRANHDYTFRPNLLNHVTFGLSRQRQFFFNPDQAGNWPEKIGLQGVREQPPNGFPVVNFSSNGLTNFAATNGGKTQGSFLWWTWHLAESVSWIKGRHEFKFGFDFRRQNVNQDPIDYSNVQGSFTFANFETANPASRANTGNAFASFLLGAVDQGQVRFTALNRNSHFGDQGWYVQDNFKVTSKLTLNLGVRYEIPLPRWDSNNEMTSFSPNLANPAAGGIPGALAYAGSGPGHTGQKYFSNIDYKDVAPRLGFAYALNQKTVIRGGWGIYYAPGNALSYGFCDTGCNFGYDATPVRLSDGLNPAFLWDGGFVPPAGFTPPPNINPSYANGSSPAYISPESGLAPRIQNWSVDVQRQLPGSLFLDVAYAASRGARLNYSPSINQDDPKYLALGALLQRPIGDPQVTAAGFKAPYPGFSGTLAQALRPYPQYSDIVNVFAPLGTSNYQSLQVKLDRRFRSFNLMVAYTFSKSLSNGAFEQGTDTSFHLSPQNSYNLTPEKSLLQYDRPSVLSIIYSYELPFGEGRRFLGSSNGVAKKVVSGWSFSAVQQYESGSLIQVAVPNTLGNGVIYALRTRPNVTGQPFQSGTARTDLDPNNPKSYWLNPAAFALAPAFTFGNAANFYGALRNPMFLAENMSLQKNTKIRESINLQYRLEASNIFNRTEFGSVQSSLTAANFGRPTGAMDPPRVVQMGLKLIF